MISRKNNLLEQQHQQRYSEGKLFFRFASDSILNELFCSLPSLAGTIREQLKNKLAISPPLDIVLSFVLENGKTSREISDTAVLVDGQKLLIKRVPQSMAKALLAAATETEKSERTKMSALSSSHLQNRSTTNVADSLYEGLEQVSDSDEDKDQKQEEVEGDDEELPDFQSEPTEQSEYIHKSEPPSSLSELHVSSEVSLQSEQSSQASDLQVITPTPSEFYTPDDFEDEQLLIQRVMEQQQQTNNATSSKLDHHGKSRETLANRYYRARNLTWSKSSDYHRPDANVVQHYGGGSHHSVVRSTRGGRGTSSSSSSFSSPVPLLPIRENYICHICGEKGHHIRNCPKGNDPKKQKKVKPSTGLPRSWLQRISDDQIAQVECDVYSLPDGTFAILKPEAAHASAIVQPVEKKIHQRFGDGVIADHLKCSICEGLFDDAVLVPCCAETFCRKCVFPRLSDCPSCHSVIDSAADLEANKAIQEAVEATLRVGRLKTTNEVEGETRKFETVDAKPVQSLPPGTIRHVEVRGIKPIPLGGRLVSSSQLKRATSSINGSSVERPTKKQAVK